MSLCESYANTVLIIVRLLDWFYRMWRLSWFDVMTDYVVGYDLVDSIGSLIHLWWTLSWFDTVTRFLAYEYWVDCYSISWLILSHLKAEAIRDKYWLVLPHVNTELIIIRYLDWVHRMWKPGWFDMMTDFIVCKDGVDLVSWLVLLYVNTELIRYHDRFVVYNDRIDSI